MLEEGKEYKSGSPRYLAIIDALLESPIVKTLVSNQEKLRQGARLPDVKPSEIVEIRNALNSFAEDDPTFNKICADPNSVKMNLTVEELKNFLNSEYFITLNKLENSAAVKKLVNDQRRSLGKAELSKFEFPRAKEIHNALYRLMQEEYENQKTINNILQEINGLEDGGVSKKYLKQWLGMIEVEKDDTYRL